MTKEELKFDDLVRDSIIQSIPLLGDIFQVLAFAEEDLSFGASLLISTIIIGEVKYFPKIDQVQKLDERQKPAKWAQLLATSIVSG